MGITRAQQQQQSDAASRARPDPALPETRCKASRDVHTTSVSLLNDLDELEAVHGVQDDSDALARACAAEAWSVNQMGDLDADRTTPAHAMSRIAALNRELKALEVRYFRTRLQLEKSMEKVRAACSSSACLRAKRTSEADACDGS